MAATDITKEMIQVKPGYEINGFKIDPCARPFSSLGRECIELNVKVEPRKMAETISITIRKSGDFNT